MGYSTYEDAHGRGYATEAVNGLLQWAFAQPHVRKVCATIPSWNVGSRRVAEKVGMTRAGLIWEEELGEDVELWGVQRR
jgi:RimJ/RimL family protein N-acetyltransferase